MLVSWESDCCSVSWQPHFHLHGKNEGSLMNLVYIMSIKPFLMRHNPCSRAGDVRGMSWWVSNVMPLWYNQGYISFTPWPGWSHWRSSKVGGVLSGKDWQDYQWGSREYQTMCNLESIQSMQQWSGGVKHYQHHHTTPLIVVDKTRANWQILEICFVLFFKLWWQP